MADPNTLPNLACWLKTDNPATQLVLTPGGYVTQWLDQSGNARHFTGDSTNILRRVAYRDASASGVNKPTLFFNNDSVYTSGDTAGKFFLQSPHTNFQTLWGTWSCFYVIRPFKVPYYSNGSGTGFTGGQIFGQTNGAVLRRRFQASVFSVSQGPNGDGTGPWPPYFGGNSQSQLTAPDLPYHIAGFTVYPNGQVKTYHYFAQSFVFNGLTLQPFYDYTYTGISGGTGIGGLTTQPPFGTVPFEIGQGFQYGEHLRGDISEIIFYANTTGNGALSDANFSEVVSYLKTKFFSVAPVIQAQTLTGVVSLPFNKTVAVTGTPTNYSATGLPSWATLNGTTGNITGTPDTVGTTNSAFTVSNQSGTSSANVTFQISSASAPQLQNQTVNGIEGEDFLLTLSVLNPSTAASPISFSASNLPADIVLLNSNVLSGSFAIRGTYTSTITATNSVGSASATITFVVSAPNTTITITNPTSSTISLGSTFSISITATGSPTVYAIYGTPAWLIAEETNLWVGVPPSAGTYSFNLVASNGATSDEVEFTLTVVAPVTGAVLPPIFIVG